MMNYPLQRVSAMNSGHNQTVNRAELTSIILAMRKIANWPDEVLHLRVFSDSQLCINGLNKWINTWKLNGWTRDGKSLLNADLWKLVDRVVTATRTKLRVTFTHVRAHVGIYGNEKADRLAKAAAKRAITAATRSVEVQLELQLEAMADAIVAGILAK